MTVLWVALGAAVGAPARYLVDRAVRARCGGGYPWGTLLVNTAGSLLLGFLTALPAQGALMAGLGTGFCGALTTYSTFGHETLLLLRGGARPAAALNVVVSLAAGLGAAYAGMALAR